MRRGITEGYPNIQSNMGYAFERTPAILIHLPKVAALPTGYCTNPLYVGNQAHKLLLHNGAQDCG